MPEETDENLRLLIVLDGLYPIVSDGGGAEKQVRTLARALYRKGVNIEIVVPMVSFGPQVKNLIVDDIPVYRIPYPKLPAIGSMVLFTRLLFHLVRRRKHFDVMQVVIAHRLAAVTCFAGRLLKKPVVMKLTGWLEVSTGMLSPNFSRSFQGHWMKQQFLSVSYYQALSKEIAELLPVCGYSRDKTRLVPNAVDTEKFSPVADEAKAELRRQLDFDYDFIAVFVGRLVKEKGLDALIRAWHQAYGREDAHLILTGRGPLSSELQALVAELGLEDRVHFTGPRKDIDQILKIADIGLLPSNVEGLSNSLLEYMSAGLPVIASRIGGTIDLIEHGSNGLLFDPGDTEALRDCLSQLKNLSTAERQAIGTSARETVIDYASVDRIADTMLGLYKDACSPYQSR